MPGTVEAGVTAYRRVPAREPAERASAVGAGARALADGAVLAHPTATVYGLGGAPRALDPTIARLKGRDPDRPLLRIGPDEATVRRRHPELRWGPRARRLAGAFWPGPLTLVLPDGSGTGLGVRVEEHGLTRAVLEQAEATMSSTSLNRSGRPPARTPDEVARALDAMPEVAPEIVWLDAGALPASPPSTLVSLLEDPPRLLREGAVPADEVEARLGEELDRG